ncbi:CIA30 family protein [Pontiellaceae bacterium B12227]|nr:CIA30 family protein [Pontiellaceae bacterium B12227]
MSHLKEGLGIVVVALALTADSGETIQMNEGWYAVNDGVMGGLSQSRAEQIDGSSLRFSGIVSFENNGGFASIRRSAEIFELEDSMGIRLRIKGDGKNYQLRFRTSQRFDGVAYKHDFSSVKGAWSEVELMWSDFVATFRGRAVPGAPALSASAIEQVGFLIADKQEGVFSLDIASLDILKK